MIPTKPDSHVTTAERATCKNVVSIISFFIGSFITTSFNLSFCSVVMALFCQNFGVKVNILPYILCAFVGTVNENFINNF